MIRSLVCVSCGRSHPVALLYGCEACGGILEVVRVAPAAGGGVAGMDFVAAGIGLGEGGTPLREANASLAGDGFAGRLLLKDETRGPSGSFKDRMVAAALSRALALGARRVVCASSGNAGASVACYAAHAGVPAIIVCPERTPEGKLAQIAAYGATLLRVEGDYSNSYDTALKLAADGDCANLTTTFLNPFCVDGLRPVGHELFADLGGALPDWVIVPTGAGPLVKGVVQGFMDVAGRAPRMVAVQAEGCAPIVAAFEAGADAVTAWGAPTTFASGISDPLRGYERDGAYTLSLVRESGGVAVAVSDDSIRESMRLLAAREGLFAEPTGASSLAACRKLVADGRIAPDATVVCLVTGHGFKDFAAWQGIPKRERRLSAGASMEEIVAAIE